MSIAPLPLLMARPQRLTGHSYIGRSQYFLTFCVRARRHVFVTQPAFAEAILQIRQAAADEQFVILAYCFMPDHVHLLVEGIAERADLRRFVQVAKRRSGAVFARSGYGALWQEGYYERVLRVSEDARWVARYIIANPVRAGLVQTPDRYPFLGSDVWALSEMLASV